MLSASNELLGVLRLVLLLTWIALECAHELLKEALTRPHGAEEVAHLHKKKSRHADMRKFLAPWRKLNNGITSLLNVEPAGKIDSHQAA